MNDARKPIAPNHWHRIHARQQMLLHTVLVLVGVMMLTPFILVAVNSLRTTQEQQRSLFGFPQSLARMFSDTPVTVLNEDLEETEILPEQAFSYFGMQALKGFRLARQELGRYIFNSIFVCVLTALGVVFSGSLVAYLLSRYRFPGNKLIYFYVISTMMFPAVLLLVPSFMVVKNLGLLNSYWVLILPYIAGGQVFAIFVFKGFFDGLPEELFESARIDGAGHMHLYWNIVLPLSKPILSVVAIMNILGTWNNFMWPFVTNTDAKYHVIASGLYIMARSTVAQNPSIMNAAYLLASLPLLLLFIIATRPFVKGVTSGAFKA